MQQLQWASELPEQTLEGGVKLPQELQWNVTVTESEGVWFVRGGHRKLLKTSSRESVDAFLYGLALAYSVMPREILNQLRAWAQKATQQIAERHEQTEFSKGGEKQ
jgi:hypothetical protein